MGSPSQTTSSMPTMDPQLKSALMGNINTANMITSGILPNAGSGSPGQQTGVDEMGNPTYADAYGSTGAGAGGAAGGTGGYTPPKSFTADFTPDQLKSFEMIRNLATNPLSAQQLGGDVYGDLSKFQNSNVSGSNVNPAYFGPTTVAGVDPMQAGQVAQVGDVNAAKVGGSDIAALADPYMSQVVDPVKAYFDQQSDRAGAASQAQARAQGALRGSNRQVGEALARGEVATAAGNALSPLYADAFKTSAGLASGNADRTMQAGLANQGTQLQRATTQAGLDTTAAGQNLGVRANQASQNATLNQDTFKSNQNANLTAGMANQSNALQAGIANQGAGIQAAGVRGAGAAGMAAAQTGAQNSAVQGAGLLNNAGTQQQDLATQRLMDVIKALQLRTGVISGAMPSMTGQTQTTTGGGSGAAGILGGIGALASGIGALGGTGGLAALTI